MTFGDHLRFFLQHLPIDVVMQVQLQKPTTVEEMYHAAREYDQLQSLHDSLHSSNAFKKKFKNIIQHGNNQQQSSTTHPLSFPSSDTHTATPLMTAPSNGVIPMDLDVMESTWVGANQNGTSGSKQQGNQEPHLSELEPTSLMAEDITIPDGPIQIEDVLGSPELHVLNLADDPLPKESLPIYPIELGSKDGQRYIDTTTIVDTGAPPMYIKHSISQLIGADIYLMATRAIIGAGSTTTSAWAIFSLQTGMLKTRIYAYILDNYNL
ncbi:hypothetical protein NEOLEDRAFT_1182124 [Neolentinus lepideus HHB14362 ss-1]|uniref:Uncharacterized protein n=1 Tax=Neolentinus lepideus HHB14362 ss-1 TaxID=1314782 RepID=A0A165PE44_9AGAM|nr:hypothetical protein NEOLEDRAFT_1182124 [Neolentinus lepideus HHB14362 ss-1]